MRIGKDNIFGWGRVAGAALTFASLASVASAQLKATVYATGFSLPILMLQDPTSPSRQFVLQQRGLIRVVVNGVVQGTNALDLTSVVSTAGDEKGLLGMAFPPNYAATGTAYIYYTTGNTSANTVSWIVKVQRNAINPAVFDAGSRDPIFTISQPFLNHNGGTLRFGPDGMLYMGLGDGGSAGDPSDRAQNLTNLLGKMLRIDPSVDGFPPNDNKDYSIPAGQPFNTGFGVLAPEIWDIGLRNPWKWSFDDPTKLGSGGILIADVGQDSWEEINYEPPTAGPRNYGWRRREGYSTFTTTAGPWTTYRDPIWVYSHSVGIAITGGYVYRGLKCADAFGRYFFADYGTDKVWDMKLTFNGVGEALNATAADVTDDTIDLSAGTGGISSIDVDSEGELYLVDYFNGRLLRIEPENRAWQTDFAVQQANPLSGELRSLSAEDGKPLVYGADFSQDTIDGDAGVLKVGFNHNRSSVTSIQVTTVAKTNQPVGHSGRIALRNWITGRFDVIQTVALTTNYQTFTSTATAAANYVRSSDGRIEVGVLGTSQSNLVDPVATTVDRLRVAVN